VPTELDNYHSLYPLELIGVDGNAPEPGKLFGFNSVVYKGISDADGLPYVPPNARVSARPPARPPACLACLACLSACCLPCCL
jgi:hypothetical protein